MIITPSSPYAKWLSVKIDDKEISNICYLIDTERKIVGVYKKDDSGMLVIDGDGIAKQEVSYSEIELGMRPETPPEYKGSIRELYGVGLNVTN